MHVIYNYVYIYICVCVICMCIYICYPPKDLPFCLLDEADLVNEADLHGLADIVQLEEDNANAFTEGG